MDEEHESERTPTGCELLKMLIASSHRVRTVLESTVELVFTHFPGFSDGSRH